MQAGLRFRPAPFKQCEDPCLKKSEADLDAAHRRPIGADAIEGEEPMIFGGRRCSGRAASSAIPGPIMKTGESNCRRLPEKLRGEHHTGEPQDADRGGRADILQEGNADLAWV